MRALLLEGVYTLDGVLEWLGVDLGISSSPCRVRGDPVLHGCLVLLTASLLTHVLTHYCGPLFRRL